jgi:hypothetical protein
VEVSGWHGTQLAVSCAAPCLVILTALEMMWVAISDDVACECVAQRLPSLHFNVCLV